jgi:cyclic beta-1,2-glucan synthetase
MYSHGVQWLVRACRLLTEQFANAGDPEAAQYYRDAASRLWFKIAAISHATPEQIEIYGGQPNKQCADYLTKFDPGRMIWNGYTGAAAWMLRQAIEGVMGATLAAGEVQLPNDLDCPRGDLTCKGLKRDVSLSPFGRETG